MITENLLIEKIKEDIKAYYIAADKANATNNKADKDFAIAVLAEINKTRLSLGVLAEKAEIFFSQINIPAQSSANNVYSEWFSKNDKSYRITRGIASLLVTAKVGLEIQGGSKAKVITRNPTAWQQIFSTVQSVALGQQIPFDLPEELRFTDNQSLQISVQGQTSAGYIFLHGNTNKENLEESTINGLKSEIFDENGNTKYLPETQLVPLSFEFPSATIDTFATDGQGKTDIFSLKSEKSVLLTHVSTTAINCRIFTLQDEGKNQTITEQCEMAGLASLHTNAFTTYYPLPKPHLLRKGDRLKVVIQNGSPLAANVTQAADVQHQLTFKGLTF